MEVQDVLILGREKSHGVQNSVVRSSRTSHHGMKAWPKAMPEASFFKA